MEFAIIKTILNSLFIKGVRTIKGTYIPTLKNRQTENFYDLLGFSSKALPDNSKEYVLEITEPFIIENLFTINLNID